ncbi:hypothetical protein EOI86_18635 [Hwanghaeella grinnelliae]|uniref:Uncharacterized protein n=1 Tax=Hwanghaeella grinnelliae TaxID=2500179 RepID=A0A437QK30_9PROT|nr:hypothetical protein [Hwanghaeella grinnelliae]RVU34858.1 hypothetical protein EOI86_18635 [Hwanghaeella grinnelliae]
MTLGNGTSTTFAYEADDDLAALDHIDIAAQPFLEYGFTYNNVGQRASMTVSDTANLFRPANDSAALYTVNALNQYTAVPSVPEGASGPSPMTETDPSPRMGSTPIPTIQRTA